MARQEVLPKVEKDRQKEVDAAILAELEIMRAMNSNGKKKKGKGKKKKGKKKKAKKAKPLKLPGAK